MHVTANGYLMPDNSDPYNLADLAAANYVAGYNKGYEEGHRARDIPPMPTDPPKGGIPAQTTYGQLADEILGMGPPTDTGEIVQVDDSGTQWACSECQAPMHRANGGFVHTDTGRLGCGEGL